MFIYIHTHTHIYIRPPPGFELSGEGINESQAKELTSAIRVIESSSNELSTLVSGKAKCKQATT